MGLDKSLTTLVNKELAILEKLTQEKNEQDKETFKNLFKS